MARKPMVYVPDMGPVRPLGQGTAKIGGSSNIRTTGPFTQGHMAQYGRPQPAARQYGGGSGDRSRDAFARANSQQAGNAYMQQMEDTNRQYQRQAEQARSADINAQRGDAARRYGMDESYKADRRGIQLSRREDLRNLRAKQDEFKRNIDQDYRNNMINLAASGGAMSATGNAWNAFRGGREGVPGMTGGLMGGPTGSMMPGRGAGGISSGAFLMRSLLGG